MSICGKNFDIVFFSDTITMINVKLWITVVPTELYPFIPLSVTLTVFQVTAVSNIFDSHKKMWVYVIISVRPASWLAGHVSVCVKNFHVLIVLDTRNMINVINLHDYNFPWGLHCHST